MVLVRLGQGACAESSFRPYLVTVLALGFPVEKGLELSGGVAPGEGVGAGS